MCSVQVPDVDTLVDTLGRGDMVHLLFLQRRDMVLGRSSDWSATGWLETSCGCYALLLYPKKSKKYPTRADLHLSG